MKISENSLKIEISKKNLTILSVAAMLVMAFAIWRTGGVAESNPADNSLVLQFFTQTERSHD